MDLTRKQPIYGNCLVYSPNGDLMFRCEKKRIDWYLKRNLAVKMSDSPTSIKLTFEPKGKGESLEYFKTVRENKCVVCGSEELSTLTRHHIVPTEYRQFFPSEKKSHRCKLIVPICIKCHEEYETKALVLKKSLSENLNVPRRDYLLEDKCQALGLMNAILKNSKIIPENVALEIKNKIFYKLSNLKIVDTESELDDVDNLKKIFDSLKKDIEKNRKNNKHGKLIVEKMGSLDDFENIWIRHFIENAKPKYAPEYLSI